MTRPRIAFLFLGETLLIPHLLPIAEAVARARPDVTVDAWIATGVHERLLAASGLNLRRAPGFRAHPELRDGENPPLPPKLPTLARLASRLLSADLIVCAEQTSLWLPRVLPFLRRRFVKAMHGAGTMMARDDPRRRAARRLLVPAEGERQRVIATGVPAERVVAVGYPKAAFARAERPPLFADGKPVLLYNPHWQRHRSSWWRWGREVVTQLVAQRDWNVILAPHQRLAEKAPELRPLLAEAARHGHVHADVDSFACVDGSYLAAADLYLGDTSSQVVEFVAEPRPCVFLDAQGVPDWQVSPDHAMWSCGEVVGDIASLGPALARARAEHPHFAPIQRAFAAAQLGDVTPAAADRAAAAILELL